MSLFGRGREKRLQAEIDRQTTVITVMEAQIERMVDLLADSNGKFDALLESHSLVLKQNMDLLADLKEVKEAPPAPTFAPFPLHVPEWEEDAAHQLETGQIDLDQYKEILKAAGLEPNIEVDLS